MSFNIIGTNMAEQQTKQIDTTQVVKYLNFAFAKAAQAKFPNEVGRVSRNSILYQYQVDFSYLIDEIERGPVYIISRVITDANTLIETMKGVK
jgi:hypothetical protein